MSTFRCIEPGCRQPIRREQAVQTKAGGYTGGKCERHFQGASMEPELNAANVTPISEPTTETTVTPIEHVEGQLEGEPVTEQLTEEQED
jgi:hypothetical protein